MAMVAVMMKSLDEIDAGPLRRLEEAHDAVFELPLDELRFGPALRRDGLHPEHVQRLVEAGNVWPAILVWGPHNVVVDGVHRVTAARRLGLPSIAARRFAGTYDEAFVESIRHNVVHGLPLTFNERQNAARAVLERHRDWSDRRIAGVCALSAKTVTRLRRELALGAADGSDPPARVGRDGRLRRVEPNAVRAEILKALRLNPDASLRAIAAEVGASPETVRSVRNGLRTSASEAVRASGKGLGEHVRPNQFPSPEPEGCAWVEDSAFASLPAAKEFASWFESSAVDDEWLRYLPEIPLSRTYAVADEARRRAATWLSFAQTLEGSLRGRTSIRA